MLAFGLPGGGARLLMSAAAAVLVSVLPALAGVAEAQIYVVKQPDGSQRFTTRPEPGAEVYIRTRHTTVTDAAAAADARFARPVRVTGRFSDEIIAAAIDHRVDPELITAVISVESAFDPLARSHVGAQGLMQLMPATARELGVADVWDPEQNIDGGTRYLARLLRKYDDTELALAAYNAGETAVERYRGIPPYQETQSYVRKVVETYRRYRGLGGVSISRR